MPYLSKKLDIFKPCLTTRLAGENYRFSTQQQNEITYIVLIKYRKRNSTNYFERITVLEINGKITGYKISFEM